MIKRSSLILSVTFILLTAAACQEKSITATVGTASIRGAVVMSGDLVGVDPSGIEVRVPGTGIATVTGVDGRFELFGVADGETDLVFRRGDGIEETRVVSTQSDAVTVEITGRRGRGRPVSKPGHSIQGSILEVRESSILIDNVLSGETEVFIDENTFIFKGAVTLLISDLEVGELVHVRAYEGEDETWVAQSISVSPRHAGDPRYLPRSAVGEITSLGENQLTVMTETGEVMVQLDERTEIYTKNLLLQFEDLEIGDRVKVFGAKLEDGTIIASWIRVQPRSGDDDGDDDGEDGDDTLGNAVHGMVLSVAESSFVVRDGDGLEVTVEVVESTEISRRGKQAAFSDIMDGTSVTAIGTRVDETNLIARKIKITK